MRLRPEAGKEGRPKRERQSSGTPIKPNHLFVSCRQKVRECMLSQRIWGMTGQYRVTNARFCALLAEQRSDYRLACPPLHALAHFLAASGRNPPENGSAIRERKRRSRWTRRRRHQDAAPETIASTSANRACRRVNRQTTRRHARTRAAHRQPYLARNSQKATALAAATLRLSTPWAMGIFTV